MEDFDSRSKDVQERYKLLAPGLTAELAARVEQYLKSYAEARHDYLNRLLDVLSNRDESLREDKIKESLDQAATAIAKPLENMLENARDVPPALYNFQEVLKIEDARFFTELKKLALGSRRDEQYLKYQRLVEYALLLEVKWSLISVEEKALLERERYAALQIRLLTIESFEKAAPLLEQGMRQGLEAVAFVKIKRDEYVAKLREYLDSPAGGKVDGAMAIGEKILIAMIASKTGSEISYVKKLMENAKYLLPVAQGKLAESGRQMQASFNANERVIIAFSTTRKEANEYVKTNGYEAARIIYEDSCQCIAQAISKIDNPPLEKEAKLLLGNYSSALQSFLDAMRLCHNTLIERYAAIFFGAIAADTLEMMTDRTYYRHLDEELKQLDMDQKLNQAYANLRTLNGDLDLAIGGMDQFSGLKVELHDEVRKTLLRIADEIINPVKEDISAACAIIEKAIAERPYSALAEIYKSNEKFYYKIIEPSA